jgi:4-aminobutyrate aminotransferase / (S)-3-amino-2-methylpropionate transaminase
MTFAKKMQIAGYYYRDEIKIDQPYRVANTWLGDYTRLIMLEETLKVIERDHLVELNRETGDHLLNGLKKFCQQFPNVINSARGLGTFCSFDGADVKTRDQIIDKLRNNGIQCGPCGDKTMRLRPSLIFTKKHCDIFFDKFEHVLKSF